MSKYVMVDAISQFRMRYVVEVPDDAECDPIEYAEDSVVCEDVKEFTQKHLGETIVSSREVTLEEAIKQFREDEPVNVGWTNDIIVENVITEIGYKPERIKK